MPCSQKWKRIALTVDSEKTVLYSRQDLDHSPSFAQGSQPMSSDGSITRWIGQLQAGDPAAAQPLWERYFRHLVELARRKLLGARPQLADEEDIALSAFDSFCRGLKRG